MRNDRESACAVVLEQGDRDRAIDELEAVIVENPLREHRWCLLMLCSRMNVCEMRSFPSLASSRHVRRAISRRFELLSSLACSGLPDSIHRQHGKSFPDPERFRGKAEQHAESKSVSQSTGEELQALQVLSRG